MHFFLHLHLPIASASSKIPLIPSSRKFSSPYFLFLGIMYGKLKASLA